MPAPDPRHPRGVVVLPTVEDPRHMDGVGAGRPNPKHRPARHERAAHWRMQELGRLNRHRHSSERNRQFKTVNSPSWSSNHLIIRSVDTTTESLMTVNRSVARRHNQYPDVVRLSVAK